MKITQAKGGNSRSKLIELDRVVAEIKAPKVRKWIKEMREILPYCAAGSHPVETEHIPVLLFSSQYKKDEWQGYTGLILVEFNKLANTKEVLRVKEQIISYLQPLLVFIGSSGTSVKAVALFTLPDGSLPATKEAAACFHAHAYRRITIHYQIQLQRAASLKEPVLDRECRLSWDPDCYYNPDSLPIRMPQPDKMPEEPGYRDVNDQESNPLDRILPGMERYQKMAMLFETSLQATREKSAQRESNDPKNLLVTLARHCFNSELPEEDVVRWIYFRSLTTDPLLVIRSTIHNVYQQEKKEDARPCLPAAMNLLARMEEFFKRRYEFRFNEVRGDVEYRERHSFCFQFRPVTQEVLNGICLNAMEEGLEIWDKDVRRYVYSPRVPHHHPVREFLDHLPPWDGIERIRALAHQVPTSNPAWPEYFYLWFLSMVAHWQKQDLLYANSLVPILTGGQGFSKSVFFRRLLPPALQEYYVESINLANKTEAELLMAQNVLIILDEFDRLGNKYQADLKHLIQLPVVKVRRPHQKTFQQMQRLASFAGTANPMDLLNDPTGSRRYICVKVTGPIDISHPIDYEQVYTEALQAIRSGKRYWLNKEEEQKLTENNTAFQQMSLEIQYLFSYFRLPEEGETSEKYLAVELLNYITLRSKRKFSNTSAISFARQLNAMGIQKTRTSSGAMYYLIKKAE